MNSSAAPSSRLDRLVDFLLDRQDPFWNDERHRAIYNEAAAAALMLQTYLVVVVGGVGLLIVGRPALGLVTTIVLCGTAGHYLIMAILNRRHVELFPRGWRKKTSWGSKAFAIAITLFYIACALWAMVGGGNQ